MFSCGCFIWLCRLLNLSSFFVIQGFEALNVIFDDQLVASLKNRVDAAAIPAAKKADLRAKISQLDVCIAWPCQAIF